MADEDAQRGTAKRQIARLIGNSSVPIYVVGEGDQLLFANESLALLLGVDLDALIGLDCSSPIPSSNSQLASIASRLALPPNTDRSLAQFFAVAIPNTEAPYLGVAFPLEDGPLPMTLCAIKPDTGDLEAIRGIQARGNLHRVLMLPLEEASRSANLWFLIGTSPSIARTRAQLLAACQSKLGVHVRGSGSSTNLAIAKWIAQQRIRKKTESIVVIECRLMDVDLLKGMLELVAEESQRHRKESTTPWVILHEIDRLAPDLIGMLCSWHRSHSSSLIATSNRMDLLDSRPNDVEWGDLVAGVDSHIVHVPSLSQRTCDVETLVAAWLEWFGNSVKKGKVKYRWTQPFVDAMVAYSWPGDIQEMDEAMRHAVQQCSDCLLTDRDLPVPLRTYPSQMQRPESLAQLDLDAVLQQFERDLIERALTYFPRNRTAAANHLGISRARLLRRLQQLGLDSKVKSSEGDAEVPVFEDWSDEDK